MLQTEAYAEFLPWLAGALGLVFGSFITAISYRMPLEKPWMVTRSVCPHCRAVLKARDLIPVMSWLISDGSCRYCRAQVHWRYPVIELLTALCFIQCYFLFGISAMFVVMALLCVCVMTLIITDLEHYMIPDEIQIAMAVLAVAHGILLEKGIDVMLQGALLGFGVGAALHYGYYYYKGVHGLGFGDVKLMAVAGLWLGPEMLVPFLFYGGLLGVFSALLWRVLGLGKYFPFGPALAITLCALIIKPDAAQWFWKMNQWWVM